MTTIMEGSIEDSGACPHCCTFFLMKKQRDKSSNWKIFSDMTISKTFKKVALENQTRVHLLNPRAFHERLEYHVQY
jgi:hypothetical protein